MTSFTFQWSCPAVPGVLDPQHFVKTVWVNTIQAHIDLQSARMQRYIQKLIDAQNMEDCTSLLDRQNDTYRSQQSRLDDLARTIEVTTGSEGWDIRCSVPATSPLYMEQNDRGEYPWVWVTFDDFYVTPFLQSPLGMTARFGDIDEDLNTITISYDKYSVEQALVWAKAFQQLFNGNAMQRIQLIEPPSSVGRSEVQMGL